MNFKQITEETKKSLCGEKGTDAFFLNMAVDEIREQTSKVYKPGWEIIDFDESEVSNFYINFRACLQFIGMRLTDGNEERDKMLYDDLTEVLAALREVIIRNFQIELPEARVVSMTDEMVEDGFLESFRDKNGQLMVRPIKNYFDIKIKIVKTPDGPVQEAFRKRWLEVPELPARKFRPGEEDNMEYMEYKEGGYRVPKKKAIEMLREVSPEVANEFAQHFGELGTFIFHLDEAEVVP